MGTTTDTPLPHSQRDKLVERRGSDALPSDALPSDALPDADRSVTAASTPETEPVSRAHPPERAGDADSADAVSADAVSADADSADAVSADADSADAVSADAVSADADSADAVSADAVSAGGEQGAQAGNEVPRLPSVSSGARQSRSPDTVLEEHRQSIASILKSLTDSLAPAASPDGGEPGESLRRSLIGQRIGNYEIMGVLSSGGMGDVFEATHTLLQRKVAIKVLRPEHCADHALVHRFFNEARAANSIRHPNIVEVVDVGMLPGGLPYIAMECLEGETLAERLKRDGPLAIDTAADFAAQAAGALRAAHKLGIVHRDLKPDNLFIVEDPRVEGHELVKVLDFGIAKLRDDKLSNVRTNAGSILGTPPYMSPEQCRGVPEAVDHRSDIYALGVILFEMLCGAPPFVAEGVGDVMVMHLSSPPPMPTWRRKEIPVRIEQTILRALEKDPDQRIPTMADFIFALGNGPTPVPYILTPTGLTADLAFQGQPTPGMPSATGLPPLAKRDQEAALADATASNAQRSPVRARRTVVWAMATGILAFGVGWFGLSELPAGLRPVSNAARQQAAKAPPVIENNAATRTSSGHTLRAGVGSGPEIVADSNPPETSVSMSLMSTPEGASAELPLAVDSGVLGQKATTGESESPGSILPASNNEGRVAPGDTPSPRTNTAQEDNRALKANAAPKINAPPGDEAARPAPPRMDRDGPSVAKSVALEATRASGASSPKARPVEHDSTPVASNPSPEQAPSGASSTEVAQAPNASAPVVQGPKAGETTPSAVRPAAEPPAVQYGLLNFDSSPVARVSLNGLVLGTTPLRHLRLPVGTHHLQLDNQELGLRMTYKVEIAAGETVSRFAAIQ